MSNYSYPEQDEASKFAMYYLLNKIKYLTNFFIRMIIVGAIVIYFFRKYQIRREILKSKNRQNSNHMIFIYEFFQIKFFV